MNTTIEAGPKPNPEITAYKDGFGWLMGIIGRGEESKILVFQLGDDTLKIKAVKGNFSKNSPINDIFVGFETPETIVSVHLRPEGIASLIFGLKQNGIGDFSPFVPMTGYDFQHKRYPPEVPIEETEGLK